jgi:hypothetical protein
MRIFTFLLLLHCLSVAGHADAQTKERLRVLVLTDIEADPDDTQSLIRFLTYSNQWDIEGVIATTSIHQKTRVAPESILRVLKDYGKVQPNLLIHEKGYPTADFLKSRVKRGLPLYGMEGVGDGRDSEGSEWIVSMLQKKDARPLWITVWGGPNCLAQALWKIRKTLPQAEAERLCRKLRVYTISDQDDSGLWIRKTFPGVFYIVSPGYTYGNATWLGIAAPMPGSDKTFTGNEWLATHIQQGHGPLGAAYPDVAYVMEGDSPTFLHLIANGLNDPEQPSQGGWGGRYELYLPALQKDTLFTRPDWPVDEPETRPIWTNAVDEVVSETDGQTYAGIHATIWRWRKAFQHDFAARMDWCTKPYAQANHPPVPAFAHPEKITVRSGEVFRLNASGTTDPDGDSISYLWFQYREAGTYKERILFRPYAANIRELPVTAPKVEKPETVHFILQVTDKGSPALTRYKRVIVTVIP